MENMLFYFLDFFANALDGLALLTNWLWTPWDVLETLGLGQIAPIAILSMSAFLVIMGLHIKNLITG